MQMYSPTYGIDLGEVSGKYPECVCDHDVSDDRRHFWDLSLGDSGNRSHKWDKHRTTRSRRYVPFMAYTYWLGCFR